MECLIGPATLGVVSPKALVDYREDSSSTLPNQLSSRHGTNDIVLRGSLLPNAVLIFIFVNICLKAKSCDFLTGNFVYGLLQY